MTNYHFIIIFKIMTVNGIRKLKSYLKLVILVKTQNNNGFLVV